MFIKDILTIDLSEDIKNVIDLEDISEVGILSEIDSYIVTEGLAKEYENFISIFTSNIVETGVWLSGFYGSGKSYFGKLLGYLISNRLINGTPARERILQRFTGINDEALIKNTILKLNAVNARVIFLDIAKQDTSKGFAYTLFRNFLKSLELPENEHGYLLFTLMCEAGYGNVSDYILDKIDKSWADLKNNRLQYIGKIKEVCLLGGYLESDYNNILTTIRREIDEFDASKLKNELISYFKIVNDEKVVFLFDEASEAINQKKFTLLDLEGLSEALSDSQLTKRTWTIAIAQEKLDDVINNSNVNKAALTKVTDRFKTKIHLEATEVDVIIRSRLLKKKDSALNKLKEYYQNNSGKIADHSGLTGAGKTESIESFLTYYPFYQNQFNLLQNFLFGRQGYASTKVAARGMIITTYDILKHEVQNESLYRVATGWQIAKEAQPQTPVRLVNRYENAERILKQEHIDIPGRHLLETIYFLTEAEVAPASLNNIIKGYIKVPEDFYAVQNKISKALEILVDQKILLLSNGTYRITSDIEQRLLDEMNLYIVQIFKKKQQVITAFKSSIFIKTLAHINDNNVSYDFCITSDNDDELTNVSSKKIKLKVKSIYNFSEDRNIDIEQLKIQHQNDKDTIWLVPDNSTFRVIDKLLDEIERIKFLEDRYKNPNSDEGPIVRAFQAERSIKETRLKEIIEESLMNGISIYLYNTTQLDRHNWQSILNGVQRQVIQNVYHKRLASQLSDTIAERIIKEGSNQRLHTYFTSQGSEFQFFDGQGNLIGESLKPAEEILYRIRNTFIDGATLEKDLLDPPTGFLFGTVITTVAALMRGGKIIAKYNGSEKFSWKDGGVVNIFSVAREFRKASFKAIAKALTSSQKNIIVTSLQALDCEAHTGKRVDWNTNDFDLMNAVRELAKTFFDHVDSMKRSHKDFDALFKNLELCKDQLTVFMGAVSESNYIDKAESYLSQKDDYENAINEIIKAEKFIRNNLEKLRQWKNFADGVLDELNKSAKQNNVIQQLTAHFNILCKGEVVKNFSQLQQTVQKIKDAYYGLMLAATADMAAKYTALKAEAEAVLKEIGILPSGLNNEAEDKIKNIFNFASQRTSFAVDIEYDVKDKQTRFTYSEMLSFIELYNSKSIELQIIRSSLIRTAPPMPVHGEPAPSLTKIYKTQLPGMKLKVVAYKQWLQQELQKLAAASDNDEIEIKSYTILK